MRALLLTVLLFSACGDDWLAGACNDDSNCTAQQHCANGKCRAGAGASSSSSSGSATSTPPPSSSRGPPSSSAVSASGVSPSSTAGSMTPSSSGAAATSAPSSSSLVAASSSSVSGAPAPVPRHLGDAFFTDHSGTEFRSSMGMSRTGFEISTSGVTNGDVVFFVASIDSTGPTLWPNPIAPGFTQISQTSWGNDLQVAVIAWKVALDEPATYAGTYNSGGGPMSASISLFAVSGASPALPVRQTLATHDSGPATNPTVGSSPGVTTTVPNSLILHVSAVDWEDAGPSTHGVEPAGFTTLLQLGDRGDLDLDWSSHVVTYGIQATPGPTGTISATFPSTRMGNVWNVVIAVAP